MVLSELRTYLLADSAVNEMVGTRMHPVQLPQNVHYPALLYSETSNTRERDLCGPAGFAHPRVTINALAETYAEAHELAEAVRHALEGFRGQFTPSGVRVGSVRLENELDTGPDEAVDVYRVLQDYVVSHAED